MPGQSGVLGGDFTRRIGDQPQVFFQDFTGKAETDILGFHHPVNGAAARAPAKEKPADEDLILTL